MTFGDDPFGHNDKNLKGITPIEFIIGFLIIWYLFGH
jgi:hypothetical protein